MLERRNVEIGMDAKGKGRENKKRVLAKRQSYAKAQAMIGISTVGPAGGPANLNGPGYIHDFCPCIITHF